MMSGKELVPVILLALISACAVERQHDDAAATISSAVDRRIAAINETFVFADMHAHPSRFHRANVRTISDEEIQLYLAGHMDIAAANISSDMAYSGGYTGADGAEIPRGQYKPASGEPFKLAYDRLQRIQLAYESGLAVHAGNPDAAMAARAAGKLAILPALEGADCLEGSIENLRKMHAAGLRLIQLVHFRANEIGHIQTYPYSPGGLTDFGRQIIREANRLNMIIDLAHANTETILDVLELSRDPVIFSHGGLQAIKEQDRALSDDEVRAIALAGGVIGIWPNGAHIEDVAGMVDHIEHVISLVGDEHVGIGSDLRGMSRYSKGFGRDAEFRAIAAELIDRGHSDETVGNVMGGNFFRLWQRIHESS